MVREKIRIPKRRCDGVTQRYWIKVMRPKDIRFIPRNGFIAERKFDGERNVLILKNGKPLLFNRYGTNQTFRYPEIIDSAKKLKSKGITVIDGEVVSLDDSKDDFSDLSGRSHLKNVQEISRRSKVNPLTFKAFDILKKDGKCLANLPLLRRKALLDAAIPQTSKRIEEVKFTKRNLQSFASEGRRKRWEGIVFKKEDSLYELGKKSKSWLKLKFTKEADVKIISHTKGTGKRKPFFGALRMGVWDPKLGKVRPVGKVGTGFDSGELKDITSLLRRKKPIFAKITYRRLGSRGNLFEPRFKGLRTDISEKDTHV